MRASDYVYSTHAHLVLQATSRQLPWFPALPCRYRQRDGKLCLAKVVQVDRSIQPWGYGIELQGSPDIRFTEGNRLLPQQLNSECLQEGTCKAQCWILLDILYMRL